MEINTTQIRKTVKSVLVCLKGFLIQKMDIVKTNVAK